MTKQVDDQLSHDEVKTQRPPSSQPNAVSYEIHIQGQLNDNWSEWLEGMTLQWQANGEMILSGSLVDQAALMGVLNKLNRLNITILAVNETNREDTGVNQKSFQEKK
jgi:hypothetical protein